MKKLRFLGAALILVSLGYFASLKFEAKQNENKYEVFEVAALEETTDVVEEIEEENGDYCGLLSIEAAGINYPLMQSDDNDFYLHHDFEGNEDRQGSIFLDHNTSLDDAYSIIYGHNMLSTKSMFYDLYKVNLGDKMTIDEKSYKCIAKYDTTTSDAAFKIGYTYDETFLNFINNAINASDSNATLTLTEIQNKHIVSIVTCNRKYAGKQGRHICIFIED